MNKGLLTTLLAAAASVSGIQAVHANAPTILPLPDIRIGDAENNGGLTDNNYFVYTNAFRLDDKAYDAPGETATNALMWSFAESTYADTLADNTTQWFQINGKNPVSVGAANMGAGAAAAVNPSSVANGSPTGSGGSKNLRETNADGYDHSYASFRDIVLSPGWGPLTSGFPTPGATGVDHARGKIVRVYVSDGQNVVFDDIIVKSVDNSTDFASAPVAYTKLRDNQFTTDTQNWTEAFPGASGTAVTYNAATQALRAFISSGATYRVNGWREPEYINTFFGGPPGTELKYSEVGAGNWIRAKFHLFAQDPSQGSTFAAYKNIPNFRLRISGAIFSFASMLDVQHHSGGNPTYDKYSQDLAPTTSSATPRVYRVDMDPPEYTTYQDAATTMGFVRYYETYGKSDEPQESGFLCLAESSIGTYPVPAAGIIRTTFAANNWQTAYAVGSFGYTPGETYTHGLIFNKGTNSVEKESDSETPGGIGGKPVPTEIVFTASATGFDLNSVNVDNLGSGRLAVASADWLGGASTETNATRARVMPGKQYRVKYTASATVARSTNSQIRFRASSMIYQYNPRLEVGGALGGSSIAWGYLPGTGNGKDFLTGVSQAGYTGTYDLIFVSPFEINPDMALTSGTHLGSEPGQGVNTFTLYRDIHLGVDLIDGLNASGAGELGEKGNVKITNMTIEEMPVVSD